MSVEGRRSGSRIADALLTLHRDEELRRRLVERGRARARSYTAAHYVDGMLSVLDELEAVVRTWR